MSAGRVAHLATCLLTDLEALAPFDDRRAQKLQLILDAFEDVGLIAIDNIRAQTPPLQITSDAPQ